MRSQRITIGRIAGFLVTSKQRGSRFKNLDSSAALTEGFSEEQLGGSVVFVAFIKSSGVVHER